MAKDLRLTTDGDVPHYFGDLLSGDDLILQRAGVRLRTFRGDWVFDATQGLPFVEWSGRKTDARGIALATRREVEQIPGVRRCECTATLNATTRRTAIVARAWFDDGAQRGLTFAPFGVLGAPLPTVATSPG